MSAVATDTGVPEAGVRAPDHAGGRAAALRDGTALSLSALLTGLVGLACWVIAAATLPQDTVGAASGFVSGFILVAGIAQLNVGLGMLRWLPRAGRRAGTLVLRGYLVVGAAAGAGAVVFPLLPAGAVVEGAGPGLFVVASVCWALFQLQDSVLAALGRAWWVPMINGAYVLARVVALPALGSALGALGVLLSWIAPTAAAMVSAAVVITVLVARRGGAGAGGRDAAAGLPPVREVVSFLGPTYLASLGTTLLYNSVPLLVIHGHGTTLGATFFVIWTGINAADYAISGFVNSLVLRGSAQPHALGEIVGAVARRLAALVLPAAAGGIVFAPLVLRLFGPAYAEQGAAALRVLLLGMVVRVVVALAVGVRLARGDGRSAAAIQLSSTALVLLGVLLAPPGAGLVWPAAGFVLAQAAVATVIGAAVLPGVLRRARERTEAAT